MAIQKANLEWHWSLIEGKLPWHKSRVPISGFPTFENLGPRFRYLKMPEENNIGVTLQHVGLYLLCKKMKEGIYRESVFDENVT